MATTVTTQNIGDLGYPVGPKHWSLNVDADDAATDKIIKAAEPGKKHWISRIQAVGAPETGSQWFKVKADNNLIVGPVYVVKGTPIDLVFTKPIALPENTNLSIQTKTDYSLLLLVEGRTDAYGTLVSNPSPADKATSVGIDADLSWTKAPFVTSHNVYFGTMSEMPMVTTTANETYDPGAMAFTRTYYWRIDASDGITTVRGPVWTFTTASV